MEVAEIVQLVASTGFSIVIAVWSLWFTFNNIDKAQKEQSAHMTELTSAVNDNTKSIAELITLLKYELNKKED